MLSDEEKKAIENLKGTYWYVGEEGLEENIKIVLNLIEKQQKEIERLEARKYMLNAETGEISQIPIDNNYISKDKIKAKIEEVKDGTYDAKIVLQSLLEKEGE